MSKRVGSPGGFRWHFILSDLSKEFYNYYDVFFDRLKEEYLFELITRKIKDKQYFIIKRTSRYCFRMMYVNKPLNIVTYKSFRNSYSLARAVEELAFEYLI